jgi:hypothetical protein
VPASAPAGEGQRRILARGDHQVRLSRQVLHQEAHRRVNRWGIEDVVVVEDEDDVRGEGRQVVEQRRQRRLGGRG